MRRNSTRLLETPTLFGGGNATVPKCAAVVCCRLIAPAIDALVRAGQHRRSEGTHRLLVARLAGSQRPRPECRPCQSVPNHHTKPAITPDKDQTEMLLRIRAVSGSPISDRGQLVQKLVSAAGRNNQHLPPAHKMLFPKILLSSRVLFLQEPCFFKNLASSRT